MDIKTFRNLAGMGESAILDIGTLFEGILAKNRIALARAITLVESNRPEHMELAGNLVSKCLSIPTNSFRIGITGVPGVGKSTFIEALGKLLTAQGKRVAVLAVDPSSSRTHGSILGDKTRMEGLAKDPLAFIRPSPASDALGGVAHKTREIIVLCEAAGFEVILVETVGVGQSETEVHGMVDFFLLLKLAGAGDELQGIKRGIMEMADAVLINKADGQNQKNAKHAQAEFKRALHLYPPKNNGWSPQVLSCSALENSGIDTAWQMMSRFLEENQTSGFLDKNRTAQNKDWFLKRIDGLLQHAFYTKPDIKTKMEELMALIGSKKISPTAAAWKLVQSEKGTSS